MQTQPPLTLKIFYGIIAPVLRSHTKGLIMSNIIKSLFVLGLIVAVVGGWLQHLYTCFTTEAWGFLIAGALFFPIGIIHGWGIWFGIW